MINDNLKKVLELDNKLQDFLTKNEKIFTEYENLKKEQTEASVNLGKELNSSGHKEIVTQLGDVAYAIKVKARTTTKYDGKAIRDSFPGIYNKISDIKVTLAKKLDKFELDSISKYKTETTKVNGATIKPLNTNTEAK